MIGAGAGPWLDEGDDKGTSEADDWRGLSNQATNRLYSSGASGRLSGSRFQHSTNSAQRNSDVGERSSGRWQGGTPSFMSV